MFGGCFLQRSCIISRVRGSFLKLVLGIDRLAASTTDFGSVSSVGDGSRAILCAHAILWNAVITGDGVFAVCRMLRRYRATFNGDAGRTETVCVLARAYVFHLWNPLEYWVIVDSARSCMTTFGNFSNRSFIVGSVIDEPASLHCT